jgi:hypothetical protein
MQKPRQGKYSSSRPLADLITGSINPLLARRGFSQSDLVLYWEDIVGPGLGQNSEPIKLQWPPHQRHNVNATATLVVRVNSGFALDLQHSANVVIDRINAHLGWRCIGKISLKQAPLERQVSGKLPVPPLDPKVLDQVAKLVSGIESENLREALTRLGARAFMAGKT